VKKRWPEKPLGDVCCIERKQARHKGIPYVGLEHIESGTGKFVGSLSPTAVKSNTFAFAEGSVLFGRLRPYLKKVLLPTFAGHCSTEIFPLQPSVVLASEYLAYWLLQDSVIDAINGTCTGARMPRANMDAVMDFGIPVPPLPEQRRIVAILDEAFQGIAAAKANAEKNLQNADDLFESYCEQSLRRGPEGWEEKPLGELCEIKHGFAFKSKYFVNDGEYVCLTPGNFLESGGYRDRGEKTKYYSGPIPEGFVLSPGQMLLAMTEQAPGLLGSPIIVPKGQRFLHNQRLGLVCPKAGVPLETGFFFHVFNGRCFRHAVHASATGVKVRHTSPAKLGNIKVAFPTSSRQQRGIASAINAFQSEAEAVATACNNKVSTLDELKASLLHQAFSGDL
jgi:type I restriction enzyme S subunit